MTILSGWNTIINTAIDAYVASHSFKGADMKISPVALEYAIRNLMAKRNAYTANIDLAIDALNSLSIDAQPDETILNETTSDESPVAKPRRKRRTKLEMQQAKSTAA